MKRFLLFFLLLSLNFISSAYAWWDLGHMAVAKIAYENLDPEIKERADYLINSWEKDHPKSSNFVTSACFADDLKDEGNRSFDGWHGSCLCHDPSNILSQDQVDKHKNNLENRDALFALNKCIETLSNPQASDWNKAFMLRMCIHIVGDLHQPLHNATLFNSHFPFPKGDVAGTRFPIYCKALNGKSTLHNLWDSACGLGNVKITRPLNENSQIALEKFLYELSLYPLSFQKSEIEDMNFSHWKEESYRLAVEYAYKDIKPHENISHEYLNIGQRISAEQIHKAGLRLACLLNTYLK